MQYSINSDRHYQEGPKRLLIKWDASASVHLGLMFRIKSVINKPGEFVKFASKE